MPSGRRPPPPPQVMAAQPQRHRRPAIPVLLIDCDDDGSHGDHAGQHGENTATTTSMHPQTDPLVDAPDAAVAAPISPRTAPTSTPPCSATRNTDTGATATGAAAAPAREHDKHDEQRPSGSATHTASAPNPPPASGRAPHHNVPATPDHDAADGHGIQSPISPHAHLHNTPSPRSPSWSPATSEAPDSVHTTPRHPGSPQRHTTPSPSTSASSNPDRRRRTATARRTHHGTPADLEPPDEYTDYTSSRDDTSSHAHSSDIITLTGHPSRATRCREAGHSRERAAKRRRTPAGAVPASRQAAVPGSDDDGAPHLGYLATAPRRQGKF